MQKIAILTLAVTATDAIAANRFVTPTGAQAGAGANTLGASLYAAGAAGETIPVDVLGTTIIETGGAISAGELIESDASGCAIARTSGVAVARLAPGAVSGGAGELVEAILIPN